MVWDKNSDSDLINHYIVYRGIDTESTENDSFCIAPHPYGSHQDTVFVVDSLLEIGKEYFYNVVAVDFWGNRSGFSNTISSIHHPPYAKNEYVGTKEDVGLNILVTKNDISYNGSLVPSTVAITTEPLYGSVKVNPNGVISYTPPQNWYGVVEF